MLARAQRLRSSLGRQIVVCERWRRFDFFLADMNARPTMFHTILRTDAEKDFEPGNCTWGDRKTPPTDPIRAGKVMKEIGSTIDVDPRKKFMRRGRFDWDLWRRAGAPELP